MHQSNFLLTFADHLSVTALAGLSPGPRLLLLRGLHHRAVLQPGLVPSAGDLGEGRAIHVALRVVDAEPLGVVDGAEEAQVAAHHVGLIVRTGSELGDHGKFQQHLMIDSTHTSFIPQ